MRQKAFLIYLVAFVLCSCQSNKGDVGQSSSTLPHSPALTSVAVQPPHVNTRTPIAGPVVLLTGLGLSSVDSGDQIKDAQAEARAFTAPIGQQVTWSNLDTHDSGTITPLIDSYNAGGMYCRNFQQTVTIAGQLKQATTKACQQSDGSWKLSV